MLKQVLQEWSQLLSDDDRARAMAALALLGFSGVGRASSLEEEIVETSSRGYSRGWSNFEYYYRRGEVLSAGEFARAWRATEASRSKPVRIGVALPYEPLENGITEWLDAELRRPATGVEGLYFATSGLSPQRSPWQWPLRVGVPDGAGGDELIADILAAMNPKWSALIRFERPSAGEEKHDLFLIPRLDSLPPIGSRRTRATMALSCGSLPVERWPSIAKELQASAISVIESDLAGCFVSLLVELSHDQGPDVALAQAARQRGVVAPILLALSEFVESSRLDDFRRRLMARALVVDQAARGTLESATTPPLQRGVADWVERITNLSYMSETGGATNISEAAVEIERALGVASSLRPPRRLQARVFQAGGKDAPSYWEGLHGREFTDLFRKADDPRVTKLPRANHFVRGRWHLLALHIGPPREDALQATEILPESSLGFAEGHETLQVVVAAPNCSVSSRLRQLPWGMWADGPSQDLSGDIAVDSFKLPETGDSNLAWFALRPNSDQVDARILVVHENRVLQTALLTGPVGAAEEEGEGTIDLTAEADVHRGLESLYARRSFDVALVVSHGEDGEPRIAKVAGCRAELREMANTKALFDAISQQMGRLTDEAEDFTRPDSEALRILLVDLANLGVAVRGAIVEDTDLMEVAGAMVPGSRLQIVAARPEAFLPLEFVYDGAAPLDAAELCPERTAALTVGSCGNCPHRNSRDFVCPVRFWGLTKVIERHIFKRPEKGAPDFTVIAAPTPTNRGFPRPASAVFAYSARAGFTAAAKDALASVSTHLTRLTGRSCIPLGTWADWRNAVEQLTPSVLVLVPHTERKAGVEALEIGTDTEFLRASQIDEAVVGPGEPCLAILFGCSTADPTIAFASFPSNLRRAGVEITVGTLSPVLGRHAAPAMREFLSFLADAWNQARAIPLAELVGRFRRDQMARGLPFGLTVVAYGDADWTFGG